MPLIRATVANTPVKIFHLPPEDQKFAAKFESFCESDSIFGLDVESTAIDEAMGTFDPKMKLRLVQFGTATEGWALDPHNSFWRPFIVDLLNRNDKRFVSHTNYDPLWVAREFEISLDDRSIDTHPMAALLYPGRTPKNLKNLTDRHIDTGLSKAEEALDLRFAELAPRLPVKMKNGNTQNRKPVGKKLKAWGFTNIPLDDIVYGSYSGLDAIYVRRLLDILAALLKDRKLAKLSRTEQRLSRLSTSIQVRGMRLDRDYTNSLLHEIESEYLGADSRLAEVFHFSPRSPKRGPWLEARGVKFTEFSDKGNPTLDKETIPFLAKRYRKDAELGPIFADMETLSTRSNILSNLRQILNGADANGFVHPRINTQAAITGRMSIVRPAMQTFKKRDPRLRGCFISRDGYVFVGADYDSQEIRIGAAFSRDEALLEIVRKGLNQHDLTAELIFGSGWVEEQRDIAKTLDFAQQYGAGPRKIAAQLGIPYIEAKKLWLAWRKAYAGLVGWTDFMATKRMVVNPFGRQIPADRNRRYANGNYMIQSSGRDVLGAAMLELVDKGWGHTIWLPIHDEIVLEVPEEKAKKAKRVLEKCMFTEFGDIPLTASAKIIGTRWNGADLPIAA